MIYFKYFWMKKLHIYICLILNKWKKIGNRIEKKYLQINTYILCPHIGTHAVVFSFTHLCMWANVLYYIIYMYIINVYDVYLCTCACPQMYVYLYLCLFFICLFIYRSNRPPLLPNPFLIFSYLP